jgi:hypothetical protein
VSKKQSIETALFERVASLSLSPVLPVAWPNVPFTKPDNGYLRVNHIPNTSQRLFIGSSDPHRAMGILQLDVFKPKNEGPSFALAAASAVAEWFGTDLKMRHGEVTVRVTKEPDIVAAMPDDTHWMVPVVVQYESYA